MSYRFGKLLLITMIALLAWMTINAFRAPALDSVGREDGSATSESTLSAEDLALLTAPVSIDRFQSETDVLRSAPADGVARTPPGASSETDSRAKSAPGVTPDVVAEGSEPVGLTTDLPTAQPAERSDVPIGPHSKHEQGKAAPAPAIRKRPTTDANRPLPTDGLGRTVLDWNVLSTTLVDDDFKPTFQPNLRAADDAQVALTGFMAPLDEVGAMSVFLLVEFPVGCFYCQTPDPTGILLIEMAKGMQVDMNYNLVKITGKLQLNSDNPEDFLYIITDASLSLAD